MQEEVRIANELAPEAAELIQGTALADKKVKLMEITRLPPDQQLPVVRALVEGRAKSVKAAMAKLRHAATETDPSSPEPDGSEEPKGSAESAQQPTGAGGTDTALAAIEGHGPLPANAPALLPPEERASCPGRGAAEPHHADRLWRRAPACPSHRGSRRRR